MVIALKVGICYIFIMEKYDPHKIESKWQKIWEDENMDHLRIFRKA